MKRISAIYHTPTQESFNQLMIELERKGYHWRYRNEKPTLEHKNSFHVFGTSTTVTAYEDMSLQYASVGWDTIQKPTHTIIEYNAAEMAVEEKHGKN